MRKHLLFAFFMLSACELVVDIDIPLERQQITLNSFFTADSVWSARLSLNRHVLDEAPFPSLEDATVVVYHANSPVDTLSHLGGGRYASDNGKPTPGLIYEIRASSPDGTVDASSYAPVMAVVSDLSLDVADEPTSGAKTTLLFTLHDRPGENNYYQVLMIVEYIFIHPHTGDTIVNKGVVNLVSKDPSIDNENLDNGEGLFFADIFFPGQSATLKLEAEDLWFNPNASVQYVLYVRTLSEDFYQYKTSTLLQNQVSGDPFAQPVMVYNNVNGGYGILAGYSQLKFVFDP